MSFARLLISFIVWSFLLLFFYWPGQYGVLVLDDLINLSDLEWVGNAGLFDSAFWSFVNTGKGGPTGRPVSMFSFALQAQCWPDQIQCFKVFNIVLHYLSACLVFCAIYLFFRPSDKRECSSLAVKSESVDWLNSGSLTTSQVFYLAFFVSLIWALHPLQTSSVLYTIQRMALLSNFFILLGLNFWLALRVIEPCRQGVLRILCLLGVVLTWILATFSKENGLLLVVFILLVDYSWALVHGERAFQRLKLSALLGFWLAVGLFPLIFYDRIADGYSIRDFSLSERLLTQTRILFDYIFAVIQPSRVAGTVFSDVVVSTSLLTPLTTLFSVCGWIFLLLAACLLRHRLPVLFLSVFWFLTAHALESTSWPLELYFIHRNYLAILAPILLFACLTLKLMSVQQRLRPFILLLALLVPLIFGWQVRQIAHIWNDPLLLAKEWYLKLPNSHRAAEYYALHLANQSEDGAVQAQAIYEDLNDRYPGKPFYWLMRLILGCRFQNVPPLSLSQLQASVGPPLRTNMQGNSLTLLDELISLNKAGECSYSSNELLEIVDSLPIYLENDDMRAVVFYEKARIWQSQDVNKTLAFYQKAVELSPKHVIRHSYASYALLQGQPELARRVITDALAELAQGHSFLEGSSAQIRSRYQQLIDKLPD